MKDFIETLKKHGYRVNEKSYSCLIGEDRVIMSWADGEQPAVAFWCLEEGHRLGRRLVVVPMHEGFAVYDWDEVQKYANGETHEFPGAISEGKTKTGACMNALKAVLEAKDG